MDLSVKEEIFGGHKKKYYFVYLYLFKYCPDQLLKRCIANDDQIRYSPFSTLKLMEGISPQGKRLIKSYKPLFIGPLFLNIALTFAKPVLGANN